MIKNHVFLKKMVLVSYIDESKPNTEDKWVFLDSTKLKIVWIIITTFSNDAFQSYYDLFQVNWLEQT